LGASKKVCSVSKLVSLHTSGKILILHSWRCN